MYTRKDEGRQALLPLLILAVPAGWIALSIEVGLNPNVSGLTLVAALVGFVMWRIYVWRHPDGWPMPKKMLRGLMAVGFKGDRTGSASMASFCNGTDDGFIVTYSHQLPVSALVNEDTRELTLLYHRRDRSWLRREDAFRLELCQDGGDEPLVVHGAPSEFRFRAKTASEKQLASWVGRSVGDQIVQYRVSRLYVEKKSGDHDPLVSLSLIVPDGTFSEVREVIAGAKDLFWKLVGAVQAEQTDNWLK